MKKFLLLPLLAISAAHAQQQIQNPAEIQKILTSIPYVGSEVAGTDMPYKNIADRLPKLGLQVKAIEVAKLEKEDYVNTGGAYKKGDIAYAFHTNQPNELVRKLCPISDSFSFIKRGKTWLPDDRTAAFISTYLCQAPDRAK